MILGPPPCPTGCGSRVDPRGVFLCDTCWGLLSRGDKRRFWGAWVDLKDGLSGAESFIADVKIDLVQKLKTQLAAQEQRVAGS